MYQLVRQVLCIPATSASSERVFSTAGNICRKKRTRLTPQNVDALTVLKHNTEIVQWGYRGATGVSVGNTAKKQCTGTGVSSTIGDDEVIVVEV